ncbi:MAG: PKD domain-containing protein, partial [Chitinivibrionales bacterium]|nr:PKD domain-containing protein [Chitinivibrionales bacterium]
ASQGEWTVALDASGSTDDHGVKEYAWDFGDGATGGGAAISHTYNSTGPHTITLTVTDHAGFIDTDQGIVGFSVGDAPVAAFTAPAFVDESAASGNTWTVSFDASSTTDDFGIWRYEWDFGDGASETGIAPTHQYSATGTYTVTLTVYDQAGQTDQTSASVTIADNDDPVAVIAAPNQVDESVARDRKWTVEFKGENSTDDYGIWKYEWNFGDGTPVVAGMNVTHQYTDTGTYDVELTVYDNANQSNKSSHQIAVTVNEPPIAVIEANPETVEGTQTVTLSAAASSDDFGINGYVWDFGTKSYDLSGNTIDPLMWTTHGGVSQDGALTFSGNGSWGTTYAFTKKNFGRKSVLRMTITTPSDYYQYGMFGWKNTSETNGHYKQYPYAVYFRRGEFYIYEEGSSRGRKGFYTRGERYDIRITLKSGGGALYEYRLAETTSWTTIYNSSHGSQQMLKAAMDVNSPTFSLDAMSVISRATGSDLESTFSAPSDITLTVVDHGGQETQATQHIDVITAQPPIANIIAPEEYPVRLETRFSAGASTDDYGIVSYSWDFGDGSSVVYGENVGHTYQSPGNYTVVLQVTDYAGQVASASHLIEITTSGLVRCVPWQIVAGNEIPHETWSGKEITLKAVASTAALPVNYTWDFGDGSPIVNGTASTLDEAYEIQAKHIYTGTPGTPYNAEISVVDADGQTAMDVYRIVVMDKTLSVETNVAIDEALWYMHKAQNRIYSGADNQGYWNHSSYEANATASAVQAFEINGHLENGSALDDPYVETVARGMNYLFDHLKYVNIGMQEYGNPDANGNGIGISVNEGHEPYQLGAVMDAIIAGGTPDAINQMGGTNISGRSYLSIVQDMADQHSWGQGDHSSGRGGWRYNWNSSSSDNSVAQWGAIGLIPAERLWGVTVPVFVKEQNNRWLNYSNHSNGQFGYSSTGTAWGPYATTPSGMVQLAFADKTTADDRWVRAINYLAGDQNKWNNFLNSNYLYGFYSFAKAMRLANPKPIEILPNGIDWYNDDVKGMARKLIATQRNDGSWYMGSVSGYHTNTAWATVILTPTLFEKPPVAVATGTPNPAAVGQTVQFNGGGSYHLDPFRSIATYAWDFDADDGIDWSNPDATGPIVSHAFGELRNYTVTLRVGDDRDPSVYDAATINMAVTIPPHPPTAVAGGPYVGVVGEPIQLDGSGSFDVDEPEGDEITAWGWEIDFLSPRDFDDAVGVTPSVTYDEPGTFDIGLRVTDNTEVAFPESGEQNLTNDAFTSVTISQLCIVDLEARPKATKCQLTWTHDGSAEYRILRSEQGPNVGFAEIGVTSSTYSTFIDYNVELYKDYWYRVMNEDGCGSYAVHVNSQGRIRNRPPVITSTPITSAQEDELYTYDVNATDPEGLALTYVLESAPEGMTIDADDGMITWTPRYEHIGDNEVLVRVDDSRRTSASQYYRITVNSRPNLPPNASISGPDEAIIGEVVTFDASGTVDPEGDLPLTYSWSFGDGTTAEGGVVDHNYNGSGNYVVTVFVTDARGATGIAERAILISEPNRPPVADAGGPYTGIIGNPVTFSAEKSSDPDGDPLTYAWVFGDDTPGAEGVEVEHTYAEVGVYNASLTVGDGRGGESTEEFTVTITMPNNDPEANIEISSIFGNVGDEFFFDATGSTDPDDDELTFAWDFGDGATITGPNVSHVYQHPGLYTVTVTADDGKGGVDRATASIHINAPPVFVSTPIEMVNEDESYNYTAVAEDEDNHEIIYGFATAPSGMTINPVSGEISWTPDNNDVGGHAVTITADDQNDRITEQDFVLTVHNVNDAPMITSTAISTVDEGGEYSYDVVAEDVDNGDVLTYSLDASPADMSIGSTTGVITWQTGHDDIGEHTVTVRVEDSDNAFDTQTFTVTVKELQWPPEIVSAPVTSAIEDEQYVYQAVAEDQNAADILTFSLSDKPEGMTVDAENGLVAWTPNNDDVGIHTVTLIVNDGIDTDEQTFELVVENVNDAPVIVSTAPPAAQVGVEYGYTVLAEDVDAGDVLTFDIVSAPEGVVIDANSGVLTWTPTESQTGSQSITVAVSDEDSAEDEQIFSVEVQLQPEPPVFTSNPIAEGTEDVLYRYQATAEDNNGDVLTFSLLDGPVGMSVSSDGLVSFMPENEDVGIHSVTIVVEDGWFLVEQTYDLTIDNVNDSPTFTSTPNIDAYNGASYSYRMTAEDPDVGDNLSFSLVQSPSGMQIDPATGLITWTASGDVGTEYAIEARVTDDGGLTDEQSWIITIQEDVVPPEITVEFSANPIRPGGAVVVTVNATDPVGIASLTVTVDGDAVQMDESNTFYYQTQNVESDVDIVVTATDALGNETSETFSLRVSDDTDNTAPSVALSYAPADPHVDEPVMLTISASDESELDEERVWLKIDGQYVSVSGTGGVYETTYTPLRRGTIEAIATAYDISGNYAEDVTGIVVDIAGSDGVTPNVSISSPAEDQVISVPTDIIGTVNDENFAYYTIEYRETGNNEWIETARKTSSVTNDIVGIIDPTVMTNGQYQFKVTAVDKYGNWNSRNFEVEVDGQMKVGMYTLTYSDMTVDLPGLELEALRTYDSRIKTKGDFGIGWTLALKQGAKVSEQREPGDGMETYCTQSLFGTCLAYGVRPTGQNKITIHLPNAPKQEFRVRVNSTYASANGLAQGSITFEALPGTYSSLEALDNTTFDFLMDGQLLDADFEVIDPDRYRLTLIDGSQYYIDQNDGLYRLVDANGNYIDINNSGMIHSTGDAIHFSRDGQGRITEIVDDRGRSVSYEYDGHGNLQKVTDLNGYVTTYKYAPNHYLTDVIDPRGITAVRTEYDESGRMVRQIDPAGNVTQIDNDLEAQSQMVTDAEGKTTQFLYDDDGNVTEMVEPNGAVTTYTYDDDGNLLSTTFPDGSFETTAYNAKGFPIQKTDAMGNVRTFTYDARGHRLSETDALGRMTTYDYDGQGNRIRKTGPDGTILYERTFDSQGNILSETNALGETTTFTYDAKGHKLTETDPLGRTTSFTYDSRGKILTRTDPANNTWTYTYDAKGNLLTTTDPLGNVTTKEYNVFDKVARITDVRGGVTIYEYDVFGRRVRDIRPDGAVVGREYDTDNNPTVVIHPDGRRMRTAYRFGRPVRTTYPDNTFTQTSYDLRGRKTAETDENGNTTNYEYDALGRNTRIIDPLGNATRYAFDAQGNRTGMTDANGNTTTWLFDDYDRVVQIIYPDGSSYSYTYDEAGRKVRETDANGNTTAFAYDAVGNLISVTDACGGVTSYEYDANDNLIGRTDANGNAESWTYDALSRKTDHTRADGETESWTHDAEGNVLTHTAFGGDVTGYTYDALGRLVGKEFSDGTSIVTTYTLSGQKETVTYGGDVTSYTYDLRDRIVVRIDPDGVEVSYTWDDAGNRTSVSTSDGTTQYVYDDLNRLLAVTDPHGRVTSYEYDAVGNRIRVINGNETSVEYTYDGRNHLTKLVNRDADNAVLTSYQYELDPVGNRTKVTEENGRTVDYTYDACHRLIQEGIADPVSGGGTIEYTYDAVGNRLTKEVDGAVTNYTYNALNQLTVEGGISYTYDINGRLVGKSDGAEYTSYEWNDDNRLVRVTKPDGGVTEYRYDANGDRVSSITDGVVTNYVLRDCRDCGDLSQVIEERDGAGNVNVRYELGDDLISRRGNGSITYYLYDGRGSTRMLTDAGGNATDTYTYDAFGEMLASTGTTPNTYLFTGEQYDPNARFYYLRARYYDQATGRFISPDPFSGVITDPYSLHKYLYAHANPVMNTDPSGRFTMVSVSISISVQSTLSSIQMSYVKHMVTAGIKMAAIAYCVIEPGYELMWAGLDGMMEGDDAAWADVIAGRGMIAEGYQGMAKAIYDAYESFANDLIPKVKIKIEFAEGILKDLHDAYGAYGDAQEKIEKYKKHLKKAKKIVETLRDPEKSKECKFFSILEEFL